jgi:hypothetical protein
MATIAKCADNTGKTRFQVKVRIKGIRRSPLPSTG